MENKFLNNYFQFKALIKLLEIKIFLILFKGVGLPSNFHSSNIQSINDS